MQLALKIRYDLNTMVSKISPTFLTKSQSRPRLIFKIFRHLSFILVPFVLYNPITNWINSPGVIRKLKIFSTAWSLSCFSQFVTAVAKTMEKECIINKAAKR